MWRSYWKWLPALVFALALTGRVAPRPELGVPDRVIVAVNMDLIRSSRSPSGAEGPFPGQLLSRYHVVTKGDV